MKTTLTLGALAGGLLAAAFLPMAVAFADDWDVIPVTNTFVPTQVEGYPPLINEVTGAEAWTTNDLTTHVPLGILINGVDTETTIGSFTNDDFLQTASDLTFINGATATSFVFATDTQIDLANFGGGWENAWMDIPTGPDAGVSDLLITPFGDFPLFGTGFADLASVLG